MRGKSIFRVVVGVEKATVEDVWFEESSHATVAVVAVRVWKRQRSRCGLCGRRCPGYDVGDGRRRWRTLDLGTMVTFVEADAPRVHCPTHGVVVASVPWAAHGAGHTWAFDQQVAWLAVSSSKSAVTQLMRIAWRTVGAIVARVVAGNDRARAAAGLDRLDGLRRIGIDEISYRRGQKYVVVVVDHDTGTLVWAADGRTKATVEAFFDQLGPQRTAQITHVSADAADYIANVVSDRCPDAVRCADPFHIVQWANEAITRTRIDAWNQARAEMRAEATPVPGWARRNQQLPARDRVTALKGSRFALWKNPENLTTRQKAKLDWITANEPGLWRGYQLKEQLRHIFRLPADEAPAALDAWLSWARRSRLPAFVELGRKIRRQREPILAAITHNMSNALVESVNTKIRLLTRVAFGFHSAQALIAIAMLSLGIDRPTLPGRKSTHR
jgi:transposase